MRIRRGFTLIELVVVIGIIGVFTSQALQGYTAWRRTAALQQAVSDVAALLRRASRRARFEQVPYQLVYDPSTRTFTGKIWELESSKQTSKFTDDVTVTIDERVTVKEPGEAATWVVDVGASVVDESGAVDVAATFGIELGISAGGSSFSRRLELEPSGELTLTASKTEGG